MTEPSETSTMPAKPEPESDLKDRISIGGLIAVMVVTYVWFFSQVLAYTT